MSKNISIKEGRIIRSFGTVRKLEIELDDGDTGYMVPEDDVKLEPLYVWRNGDYTAEENGVYGFSEVNVNVILQGDDTVIGTDPITDDPIIGIDPKDPDDPTIPIDPTDPIDSLDPEITIDIGPTGEPEIEFEDEVIPVTPELLDELGLIDPIDITTDIDGVPSIEGTDLDGLETITPITPTGVGEKVILPSEIRVITPPDQTEYQEGDRIHFEGLVVRAYDAQGNVWSDEDYPGGFIPLWELDFDPTIAEYDKDKLIVRIDERTAFHVMSGCSAEGKINQYKESFDCYAYGDSLALINVIGANSWAMGLTMTFASKIVKSRDQLPEIGTPLGHIHFMRENTITHEIEQETDMDILASETYDFESKVFCRADGHVGGANLMSQPAYYSGPSYTGEKFIERYEMVKAYLRNTDFDIQQKISISWPRPKDNKVLTASFDITVSESEASGDGTHHSGKF